MTVNTLNAAGAGQSLTELTGLQSLLQQFDDLVDAGAKDIFSSHCSYTPEEVQRHVATLQAQERMLKVGIIGRVKAGKSSLINALLFDGRDVLPKAATPMTAALTTLTYSRTIQAEVEFFTADEINGIRHKAKQFEREVHELAERAAERQRQRETAGGPPVHVDMQQLRNTAARQVAKSSPLLKSADEIYQRLKVSPVQVEDLPASQVLEADSIEALREKLYDYVGADGHYMPFTRTLHIGLPVDGLRNLEVIDTPGLNDAVASREQRTYDMLKECNVVFVVSPAGQFLHEQDQELATRLSKREGIQEIYLVASRVDEQLHSSERTRFGGLLPDVVNGVKGELAKQAQRTLTTINNPVLAEIANKLDNRLFVTAGIAQTLLTQPEDKWDETAKHTFQLLRGNFPEYFADPKETEQSLAFLAGRDALLEVIGSVHQQKEAILAKQVNDFMAAQRSSVTEAQNALLDHFEQKKALIQDTDLADTEQALHSIVSVEATGASAANIMFKDHVDELSQGVSVELKKHIKQFSKEVRGDVKASESSESETYQRAKDGFWAGVGRFLGAGGYEESTRTVTTFQAHEARTALEDLSFFIEHGLNDAVQAKLLYWRRKLAQDLTAKLRECIGDSHVNADQLAAVCRLAIAEVKDLPAAKIPELPAELAKGGKLKGREAEEYLDEATRYISTLTRAANAYVKDVSNDIAQLAGFNIGHRLFSHLRDEAEQLQSLLKNKRLTIDKLGSLTQQLREL